MNPRDKMQDGASKKNLMETHLSALGFIKKINFDLTDKKTNNRARIGVYILFVIVFTCIADYIFYAGGTPVDLLKSLYKENAYSVLGSKFFWLFLFIAVIIFSINSIKDLDTIDTYRSVAKLFLPIILLIGILNAFGLPTNIPELKEAKKVSIERKVIEKQQAELEKRLREEELRKRQERNKLATAMDNGTIFEFEVRPDDKKPYEIKKPAIKKGQRFAFLTYTGAIWYRVKNDEKSCFAQVDGNTPYYAYVSGPLEVKSGNAPAKVTLLVYDYK